ncbi:MAG: FecR domain-containing protein [Candidatus Pseudobacter hemicellulosilyticus]|uniref:FecR domain-containing protein n=1 Tax=Candidatus Pseudobacter hemicellulosilyticus TaxID=3121375 RepID=A0AAJ5WXW4_9BACT|nr:MAG: FecR domain-containing protein [Pseudobacter sp.]
MDQHINTIQELYRKWVSRSATEAELEQLFRLLSDGSGLASLDALMKARWHSGAITANLTDTDLERILAAVLAKGPVNEAQESSDALAPEGAELVVAAEEREQLAAEGPQPAIPRISFWRRPLLRYAAAVLLLAIGAGWLYLRQGPMPPAPEGMEKIMPAAIAPGASKAILQLADGSVLVLDSAADGRLAEQQGATVIKKDGQVLYQGVGGQQPETIAWNTMSTPRGGQYRLVLPDGTKVWLNAVSSIRYPTRFTGGSRLVTITGEVYFETLADRARPFLVNTGTEQVVVLGTRFNVNAYAEEGSPRISLLEGMVKVDGLLLKPGQACKGQRITPTNTGQDIAWINGLFNFDNMPFEQAMRKLSRWYDVDIIYDKGIPEAQLSGEMDRNLTLQDALKGLDRMGARFRLEGRTVHVIALY